MSAIGNEAPITQGLYAHLYKGYDHPEQWIWVQRVTLDVNGKPPLKCANPKVDAMLIGHNQVQSICEYEENRMVITLKPHDVLLTDNWVVLKRIEDLKEGNTQKNWIGILPGYHRERFPFVVCQGRETFELINVKEHRM